MTNKWRWVVVFVIACAAIFGFLAMRPMVASIEGERMARRYMAWQNLQCAMHKGGWPADLGVHSTQEYLELLIKEGYLNVSDLALYGDLVMANVSEKDPPGTVILISRSYYNYLYHDTKFPKEYIAIWRGGIGLLKRHLSKDELPPREPSILPPRRLALD